MSIILEEVVRGFSIGFSDNNQILIARASLDSAAVIDAFYERAEVYFDACVAHNKPVLYVHTIGSLGFSQRSRERAREFAAKYGMIHGRGAYVFSRSALVRIARNFIMNGLRTAWPGMEIKEFNDEATALEWVKAALPTPSTTLTQ